MPANASYSEILATTIESRSGKISDNVTKNNALLGYLQKKGQVKTFSGGTTILEELASAENPNGGWYSGYDQLPVAAQDSITAASFTIKQAAVPVVISGLEEIQNDGREKVIDLLESRLEIAEGTMKNLIAGGVYSDGTGTGGKQLTGLLAAVPSANTTGVYGGIDRAVSTFWRNQVNTGTVLSATNIQQQLTSLYASCVRGVDAPDLLVLDAVLWPIFANSLQALQRFTSADTANLGFKSLEFMGMDVLLDGGIGGFCPSKTGYMLNTKYLKFRPHAKRNMVPLNPSRRVATNQDASVQILGFAGNVTCRGTQFQGVIVGS